MKAKKIFTDNFEIFIQLLIISEPKKLRKSSLGNTMKSYPNRFFKSIIPNTKTKKIWLQFEKLNFFR